MSPDQTVVPHAYGMPRIRYSAKGSAVNRLPLRRTTIKWMFAVNGNRCAFTGCRHVLVEPPDEGEQPRVVSEVAHIVGARTGGPRGRAEMSDEERRHPDNLILLCERHHKLVDDRWETYTPDVLRGMKARHEARYPRRVDVGYALPTAPPLFVGRDREINAAVAHLRGPIADRSADAARPLVLVTGPAGIGKSAFAVRVAHDLLADYPDGQIYLSAPHHGRTVEALLEDLVDALGGQSARRASASRTALVALVQSLMADRCLLVVLDNICDEATIREIASIDADLAVVCTSRVRLSGLIDRVTHLCELGALQPSDAADLASSVATRARLSRDDAEHLARACGGHPLAILIAASRLASRPMLSVPEYLSRLSDPERGVSDLVAGQRKIEPILRDSYEGLPARQQRLLRIMGLLPNVAMPLTVLAALDAPPDESMDEHAVDPIAEDVDLLFEHHLVEQSSSARVRLHDLVYRFCRSEAMADSGLIERTLVQRACPALTAVVRRTVGRVTYTSEAGRVVAPHIPTTLAAVDDLREPVLAMIECAHRLELWEELITLGSHMLPALTYRGHWSAARRINADMRDAGEKSGNLRVQAVATLSLGVAAFHEGDAELAAELYQRCETLARASDHTDVAYDAVGAYGALLLNCGQVDNAIPLLKQGLRAARVFGNDPAVASALHLLGVAHTRLGSWTRAERYLINSYRLAQRAASIRVLVSIDLALCQVRRETGRFDDARTACQSALETSRTIGDRSIEIQALLEMAALRARQHGGGSGRNELEQALYIARMMQDPHGELSVSRELSAQLLHLGHVDDAAALLDRAYELALRINDTAQAALCLASTASMYADVGRLDQAREALAVAESIAQASGGLVLAQVRHTKALMLMRTGDIASALTIIDEVSKLLRGTGRSEMVATARIALADALTTAGQHEHAGQQLRLITDAPPHAVADSTRQTAWRTLATVYSQRGLITEAEHALNTALSLAVQSENVAEQAHCYHAFGVLAARSDQWQDAKRHYAKAAKLATTTSDTRLMLTLRANQLVTDVRTSSDLKAALTEGHRLARLARQLRLIEIEIGLHHNLGAMLAKRGKLDQAITEFRRAHAIAQGASNPAHLVRSAIGLAKAHRAAGNIDEGRRFAVEARTAAQAVGDWHGAGKALLLELESDDTAMKHLAAVGTIRAALGDRSDVPQPVISAASALLTRQVTPPVATAAPQPVSGRTIHVDAAVQEALTQRGLRLNSALPHLARARHDCIICSHPIAAGGAARLMLLGNTDGDVLALRLVHNQCEPSRIAAIRIRTDPATVRMDLECALLTSGAAVIINCFNGWGFDAGGELTDVFLDSLRLSGFIDIGPRQIRRSDPQKGVDVVRQTSITATLAGSKLTVQCGDFTMVPEAPLSFLPAWYEAARNGTLAIVVGRNLQGMSWESLDYLKQAARSHQLVSTATRLKIVSPGRNSRCVCTPSTGLKYKRCCGRPLALTSRVAGTNH